MKIAVASMGEMVSPHFGHCENFNIFVVEDNKIVSAESVQSPGHDSGVVLPYFLGDQGVELIISGGMGDGAKEKFVERNIEIITGAAGTAQGVVEAFLAGDLVDTGASCEGHHHH